MSTSITGTTGLRGNDATRRTANVGQQVRAIGEDQARSILATLSGKLKPGTFAKGYLRLINTGNENAPLAFKRKTSLQIALQSGRNAETGEALLGLFEKAGYQTLELKSYLEQRGGRKLERGAIFNIIRRAQGAHESASGFGAVRRFNTDLVKGEKLGEGAYGVVSRATLDGTPILLKEFKRQPVTVRLGPDGKLVRSKELTARYLSRGSETGILGPSEFIIRETVPGKPAEEWIVPGEKRFRDWCVDRLKRPDGASPDWQPPTLEIVGLVLPEADGEDLSRILSGTAPLTPKELSTLAVGLVANLEQLARRGFVHGDIKHANIFFDRAGGGVQFIDTGGLAKVSKRSAKEVETLFDGSRGHTNAYTHPLLSAGRRKGGFEQDLFSVGVTILVTDLRSTGRSDEAKELLYLINSVNAEVRSGVTSYDEAKQRINGKLGQLYPGALNAATPNGLGRRCISSSFSWIEPPGTLTPILGRDMHGNRLAAIRAPLVNAITAGTV